VGQFLKFVLDLFQQKTAKSVSQPVCRDTQVCRQVLKFTRKHVKTVLFHHFGVILDLGVPPNFKIQISVPRAQKG